MTRRSRWFRDPALVALICLAAVQLAVLALARGGPLAAAPTVDTSFAFAGVETITAEGATVPLVNGRPTLVLVFHSECGHCRVVAPEWARWLESPPQKLDVVAVTREPIDVATAYAREHGWRVDVRSAVLPALGGPAVSLTGRTPWVFGLDAESRVVVGGHGTELDGIAAALAEAAR